MESEITQLPALLNIREQSGGRGWGTIEDAQRCLDAGCPSCYENRDQVGSFRCVRPRELCPLLQSEGFSDLALSLQETHSSLTVKSA